MILTAQEILQYIGEGVIYGNPDVEVNSICGIEKTTEKSISYIKDESFLKFFNKAKSPIIIIDQKFNIKNKNKKTLIQVNDPYYAVSKLLKIFAKEENKNDINKNTFIASSVNIPKDVYLGQNSYVDENCIIENNVKVFPNCFIGKNVQIKENSIIYPGVCIYQNTLIGKNCIIHSGAIIGADGFGFINRNKKNIKLYHIGNVVIKDDVEIGANTCIDKGMTNSDSTIIGENVKIDNLVQIGHNVIIGAGTIIAGLCGIAGSTQIGKNCVIGGKVAISDHLNIADNVKIAGNSGVTKSVKKKGAVLQGPIAFDKNDFQKAYVHFKNLDKNKRNSF